MYIFDGNTRALQIEENLKQQVSTLAAQGKQLKVAAILFAEDEGSILYSRLKKEAAERVGISYELATFSLIDPIEKIMAHIHQLNEDQAVTGIIIQKPWRQTWQAVKRVDGDVKAVRQAFNSWWTLLTTQISIKKDVDGLHPETLASIQAGDWRDEGKVMPATAAAVLQILEQAAEVLQPKNPNGWLPQQKVIILGQSDILGKPLYYELKNKGVAVEMMGSAGLQRRREQGKLLLDADVVISATGRERIITGELLKAGVVLIDVGEPRPDVDFESVKDKASFITPVPGGVGPMTVGCLLYNSTLLV